MILAALRVQMPLTRGQQQESQRLHRTLPKVGPTSGSTNRRHSATQPYRASRISTIAEPHSPSEASRRSRD